MKLLATKKSEQNAALADPWTVVHLGAGLAAGLIGIGFVPAFGAAVAYEVLELVAEGEEVGQKFFQTSGPESASNSAVDLAVFAAGWWLGQRWNASR